MKKIHHYFGIALLLCLCLFVGHPSLVAQCANPADQPEVFAYAFQASCNGDGSINDDGTVQINGVNGGLSYSANPGGAFTGSGTRTSLASATYPVQLFTNLPNPATNQQYTIRVYRDDVGGSSTCFTEVVVTLEVQNCQVSCTCLDYIYLLEPFVDRVIKFRVNLDSTVTTIADPWISGSSLADLAHGAAVDQNGFVYVNRKRNPNGSGAELNKFDCDGNLVERDVVSNLDNNNLVIRGSTVYSNEEDGLNPPIILAHDLCDGSLIGSVSLPGAGSYQWHLTEGEDDMMYVIPSIGTNAYRFPFDNSLFTTPSTPISPYLTIPASFSTGGQNYNL
ncbi:MAG: hypothetical protein AAGJ82_12050, partial [Bacteroidota bacterium]